MPDFIPIGEDKERNQIWLGVSETKKGQIIYNRFEAPQNKIITYEVDTSFQSFISEFHYDFDAGIKHIVVANDLEYFKNYLGGEWNKENTLEYNQSAINIIIWHEEPRPQFLDFAFSNGIRINDLLRYSHNLQPENLAVFDKYEITIPKICYSRRLQFILQSDKPIDENEFNELIKRGADINVYEVYETLQRWIQHGGTPHRIAMVERIKPYHKDLSMAEKIELAIEQKEIIFSKSNHVESDVELSTIESDFNLTFPEGLIEFLKNYQGTIPNFPFFDFTIRAANDRHYVEIDHFLTADEIITLYPEIKSILQEQEIQDHHLPIAITKSGGYLLINCQNQGEQFGQITFLYHHIIRWDQNKPHQDYRYKKSLATNLFGLILSFLPQSYVFDELSQEAKNGNIDYFKMRIKEGLNINAFTQTNQTCLHQAVRNNHFELAQFLLKNGANPNLKVATPDWDSTLAIAMKYSDKKMFQLIYENSDLAYTPEFEQIKRYLIQHYRRDYLAEF